MDSDQNKKEVVLTDEQKALIEKQNKSFRISLSTAYMQGWKESGAGEIPAPILETLGQKTATKIQEMQGRLVIVEPILEEFFQQGLTKGSTWMKEGAVWLD